MVSTVPGIMMANHNKTTVLGFENISPEFGLGYTIVRLIQGALAFFANGIILITIARYNFLHNRSTLLVASLTFADFVSFSGIVLSTVYDYGNLENKTSKRILCICKESVHLTYMSGNVLTILWIAMDRFIYCWYPVKYMTLTSMRRYQFLLLGTWVYVVLMVLFSFVLVNTYRPGVLCIFTNPKLMPPISFIVVILAQFLVLSTFTVIFYALIGHLACKKVKESKKFTHRASVSSATMQLVTDNDRREHKITLTLATVLGMYFACHIPAMVVGMFVKPHSPAPLAQFYFICVIWFNMTSLLNPIVYARGNKDMLRGLKKITNCDLGCRCVKDKNRVNGIEIHVPESK